MIQLVDKYRPLKLEEFAGLAQPRAVLSALAAQPYESAWLFFGPTGTGKTTMALAFAQLIGAEVHHIASKACTLEVVNDVVGRCWYTPMMGDWHLVLVDEADKMSEAAQLAFLSKLDATEYPPKTIFIFTSNGVRLLADRFLGRVRILDFGVDPRVLAEIREPARALLERIWNAEAPSDATAPDFDRILKDTGVNVRAALMRLEVELMAPGMTPPPLPASEVEPAPVEAPRVDMAGVIRMGSDRTPRKSRSGGPIDPDRSAACKKAWETIRRNRAAAKLAELGGAA